MLTVFVDVAVVPMDRERVLAHQTVLVRGDRIVALGPAGAVSVPAGVQRIDGRGRYLLPGLADMHVHLGFDPYGIQRKYDTLRFQRFLAEGVTTVRDMHSGGSGSVALALKRAVARGAVLGPRLYTAGDPVAEANGSTMTQEFATLVGNGGAGGRPSAVDTLSRRYALADSIRALEQAGHDFVKLYAFPHPAYDTIIAAAHRVGLRVAGHVPSETGKPGADVPLEQVLRDHWASIEHLTGYFAYLTGVDDQHARFGTNETYDTMAWTQPAYRWDQAKIRQIAGATHQAGVWNCPTFAVFSYAMGWSPSNATPTAVRAHQRLVEFAVLMVKALHEAGAGLLLGTDNWEGGVATELRALVEQAGLTPYQALETGTRNVAEFMGTLDSTGTVAVGKRADLVLLAGNPLQNIQAVASPVGVMLSGRWLSRAELEALASAGRAP